MPGYEKPCKKPDIDNIAKVTLNDIAYRSKPSHGEGGLQKLQEWKLRIQTILEMKIEAGEALEEDDFVLYTEYIEQVNLLSIEQRVV